ncbi:restriction endonuclease subunit S [Chryseobacterium chendengshani]|uniref:restriction endonuclease subunit S n=1 Tax=Chryseobacterium sp. LJ756 TaxID=2864113 RepID=UPI001C643CCD|nr:restriction endonuclease subunit S [Chryseobacterium sp. LJ756]MBW7674760.1 restriction endonuclease subunit S [Chryseobacterium sp. LJ756]
MTEKNKIIRNFPNKRNVPKLRFSEFTGDWKKYHLNEVAEKVSNKNNNNKIETVFSNSAVQGIVLQSDYFDKSIANRENLGGYYIVEPFDFVYNPRLSSTAEVGAMSVNKTNLTGLVSPLYTVFRIKESNINIPFLEYLFKSKVWHHYMRSIANYGARDDRMNVKSEDFYNLPLAIPNVSEQSIVSTFLSLIETRVRTQKKIISHLKTSIINYREKLFSQKIRFKDENENNFPEWETKKIKDILKIGSGRDYKHLEVGTIPVYGTGGIITFVNSFLYDGETVCIGRKGTINKPLYFDGKLWTVDTLFYTHSFNNSIPKFIFHVFQSINWKEYNEASGVPSLSKSTIENITVIIPSIKEQTKIANFLFLIDKKIETEKKILTQYEIQKKYLLSNLFV